jgi:hypothetical protein
MAARAPLAGSRRSHRGAAWRAVAPGFALLLACAGFASWACFRQFGGYDLSPLVDAFWRMRQGQVPGLDFVSTFPPLIYLSAKLVAPLDLGWYELTLVAIVHTVAAFGAVMAMTPPERRSPAWALVTAALFAVPLVYTNHLWHSTSSQLAASAFLFAVLQGWERADARGLAWIATAAAAVALCKQNVAAPMIAASMAATLVLGGTRRWHLMGAILIGAVIGLAAALVMLGMRVEDLIATYTAVAGRGLPSQASWDAALQLRSSPGALIALAGAVGVMLLRLARGERPDRPTLFLLLLLPVTLLPLATDWDAKLNDVALPLFLVCCWAWQGAGEPASRRPLALIVGLVLALALLMGATRERMASVGAYAFWEPIADRCVDHGYFAGLLVGGRMARVVEEMDRMRRDDPHASLFFGPRLEFGYRQTGVPSPLGLPLWWHPGSSYALDAESQVIAAFAERRFDRLLFLGRDRTRMPRALLLYIDRHYRQLPATGELQVFARVSRPDDAEAAHHRYPNLVQGQTFVP